MIPGTDGAHWQQNLLDAHLAMRMIRETVEQLGPIGALPSEEAVLTLYGPELVHEAQAIVDALIEILNEPKAAAVTAGSRRT